MAVGYSKREATQLKGKLEREVAKIEDAAEQMRRLVPDTDPNRYTDCGGVDGLLEEFRAIASGLGEVIDRRTRK